MTNPRIETRPWLTNRGWAAAIAASAPWVCGCGERGKGEAAAQRHSKVCSKMGWPGTMVGGDDAA